MKIMIVDDSKAMRMMVARTLRQAGLGDFVVVHAENAPQAFDLIAAEAPDFVLSDWNMPGMTGLELLKKLRDAGNDVRFGFVTSESTPAMRELAAEAGALFLISKPFTAESFAAAMPVIAA